MLAFCRSLALNLEGDKKESAPAKPEEEDDDDEYDIPDEIEDVIEELLCGLKDKETIIRWSAAKGEMMRCAQTVIILRLKSMWTELII